MPRLPHIRMVTRPTDVGVNPRATFLALLLVDATNSGGWDRHRHNDHEIIFVEKGRYRGRINDVVVSVPAGGLVILKPGDWHEDDISAGVRYHALWFRLPRGQLLRPETEPGGQVVVDGRARWSDHLKQLVATSKHDASAARLDALLAPLLWDLADVLPRESLAAPFISQAVGIAADLARIFSRSESRKISVIDLARALSLSPRSLERRCREELGHGPAHAHAKWRLERAAQLMLDTDWPVRAVSDALGYSNPFHFSRAFARLHGLPPARWREHAGRGLAGKGLAEKDR